MVLIVMYYKLIDWTPQGLSEGRDRDQHYINLKSIKINSLS